MSLFFESIKLLNGQLHLLDLHQARIESTVLANFKEKCQINLQQELANIDIPISGLFKVKVTYDIRIKKVEIDPYSLKSHTKIKIIQENSLNYAFKSTNRKPLQFNTEEADDVIFIRDNHVCDASYSNIIFFDGQKWITPKTYLLKGVKRESLILQKKISLIDVSLFDLEKFSKIAFINAMRDFEKTYTFVKEEDFLILKPVI